MNANNHPRQRKTMMKHEPESQGPCDQKRRSFLKLSGLLGLGVASGATLLPVQHAEAVLFGRHEYKVSDTRLAMGTFVAITAMHASRDEAQEAIGLAFAEVDRLVGMLSRHDPDSPVSRLNATGQLPDAPLEILEVVARSLYFHRQTNGAFDVTVQPIVDLYEKTFAAGQSPSDEAIGNILGRVGSEHLRLEGGGVQLARAGMGITLDGIAKGYVVDRVSQFLADRGVVNHLINAGGEIRANGSAAKGAPWTIAIQDPEKRREYPSIVRMASGCIATSGSYEAFYDQERMFHHIVTPGTGRSPVLSTSVTIKAATVMDADALATGIFVMEPARGVQHVNAQAGCECFLVQHDGGTLQSAGWAKQFAAA